MLMRWPVFLNWADGAFLQCNLCPFPFLFGSGFWLLEVFNPTRRWPGDTRSYSFKAMESPSADIGQPMNCNDNFARSRGDGFGRRARG